MVNPERPSISAVVVANRRMNTLPGILTAWLELVGDVWLADCSGRPFTAPAGVNHVRFWPDPGNRTRHALALLTAGNFVFKADDDFIPKRGLIADFLSASRAKGQGFYGVMGRRFEGPRYYGNTISARAPLIQEPTRVDFVGICTMATRDLLAFDLRGCASSIEELYQQCGAFPEIPKWVVPTKNYSHIPRADAPGCLCKDPVAQGQREAYYSKIWEKCRAIRLGEIP